MRGPRRLWTAVVVVSAGLALLVETTGAPTPLRVAVVFWFVGMCPGVAFVRLLRLDPLAEVTLAVALSLSIAALASEGLALAHLWSPTGLLAGLAGLSLLGVSLPLYRRRPHQHEESRP